MEARGEIIAYLGHDDLWLPRLTGIKFPASWRRDVYRSELVGTFRRQTARWIRRRINLMMLVRSSRHDLSIDAIRRFTEIFRPEWDPTGLPVVHVYQSRLFPNAIGAWSCRMQSVDRLFVHQGHR